MSDEPRFLSFSLIQSNEQLVKNLNNNFQAVDDELTTIEETLESGVVTPGDLEDGLAGKVDKVAGKGLSTNDYDNTAKGIVESVESGAQVNVIEEVRLNGTKINPSGKVIDVVTSGLNNLTNYYLKTETYTKTEVNNLIGAIKTIEIRVVSTLPATGESNVIYLVPKGSGKTGYIEYVWVASDNKFEEIGDTDIDLSNYYTKSETNALLNAKVDVVAGKGLSTNDYTDADKAIVDGVTSALSGKVDKVAGKGLSTNDYTTTEQTKLSGIEAGATKSEAVVFTADDASWSSTKGSDGLYVLTKTCAKRPVCVQALDTDSASATYNYYYDILATAYSNGTKVLVKCDVKFTGRILVV